MSSKTPAKKPAKDPRSRARAKPGSSLPLFPILIGAVVVIGALAIALTAFGGGDGGGGSAAAAEYGTVTVSGDPLPAMGEGGASDPAIGQIAPELAGESFDGAPVRIAADGRAKAVAFVAHWCPHCQAEVPRIVEYLDSEGLPEGVDLYVVPTRTASTENNYPPSEWLESEGATDVPTLVDDEESSAWQAYGSGGFPYLVLLDSDFEVAGRVSGELPEGTYPQLMQALADGQPIFGQG